MRGLFYMNFNFMQSPALLTLWCELGAKRLDSRYGSDPIRGGEEELCVLCTQSGSVQYKCAETKTAIFIVK